MIAELASPLKIGGDMRADSPGHSAKYGTYVTMDMEANEIINIELSISIHNSHIRTLLRKAIW